MANWIFGNYYRMKTCGGQMVIRELNNAKRTRIVEVMCEVTYGDMATQRIKYTGYLNSKENAARAYADLRAMGWLGKKRENKSLWEDTSGIGSGYEFEGRIMADEGLDGKTYARVSFPRAVRRVSQENALSKEDLARLEADIGDADTLERIAEAQEHDRKNANSYDDA